MGLPLASVPTDVQRSVLSLAKDVVKLICPITTSAGCWFLVGISFQINTRLNPRSATNRWTPSLVTEVGLSMVFDAATRELSIRLRFGVVVKFGAPKTRSAG